MDFTIGIIGGGQLTRMLIESGLKWGIKFNVLESNKSESICFGLATNLRCSPTYFKIFKSWLLL
jgi:phosphoribosylaminoimidazole carboxylase (NCAIR synthetase)